MNSVFLSSVILQKPSFLADFSRYRLIFKYLVPADLVLQFGSACGCQKIFPNFLKPAFLNRK